MPLPSDPRTFFLGGLFGLGVLAALYVASSIILPVMLALVLNLLLQPAVRLLGRLHLPRAVGALFTVFLVIGALVGLVAALSVPATTWAERCPRASRAWRNTYGLSAGRSKRCKRSSNRPSRLQMLRLAGGQLFRFAAIWA